MSGIDKYMGKLKESNMREIKFRGYCEKDSEWRFGSYCTDNEVHEILTPIPYQQGFSLYASQVDPESIGQLTGLKDKNGVDIYEGDIISVEYNNFGLKVVEFIRCCFSASNYDLSRCKVVGNTYETP